MDTVEDIDDEGPEPKARVEERMTPGTQGQQATGGRSQNKKKKKKKR